MSKPVDVLNDLIEKANSVMGKKLTTKQRRNLKKGTFCFLQ